APRSSDDGEWCHDEDRAGRGQLAEAHQGGQPVLPGAVHEVVAREGWVEAARHPRVGADGLHPEADDGRLLGQPAGAVRRGAGGMGYTLVNVEEGGLVAGEALHAGEGEMPASVRE